ncbi:MAG: restriction endonuclease [Muribaculaceae bacterium]|nr:restriction endonuclease [Muribaculaceae bacterium]
MWVVLILIIVIACLAVPDCFTILAILIGVAILVFGGYMLYLYIENKKETKKGINKSYLTEEEKKERYDLEWEKWRSERGSSDNCVQAQQLNVIDQPFNPQIAIEVKGIEDEEKDLIELGYKLPRLLIDGIRHRVAVVDVWEPCEFAIKKLSVSNYPFVWEKSIKAERRGELIVINYNLPTIEDIPDFLEITYRKDQPTVVFPNEKRIKELWTDISYQITLRSIYELFSSTNFSDIESINFNGIVNSLDLATGHQSEKCIMSVMVKRKDFMKIDFSRIDPKQCFKRLKGISAHDLSSLTPIPPIMSLNKEDKRFIAPEHILDDIDIENNLAAMDWKDFENLIRELFEKEFSSKGSEVKITRASKDGGVDAVVFDPDPIRGGKIIIQAKRYTNVVGVSAVRDLYGTVHNEGAIKGILVTTSDYGSDSYNFAKDKPLTLLNGANLLHLLGKHGYKAHINIDEAKKTLKEIGNE